MKRIGSIIIITFLALAAAALSIHRAINSPANNSACSNGESVLFEVPRGTSVNRLSSMLVDRGFISSRGPFKTWLRVTGKDRQIKSGHYSLPPCPTVRQLAAILTRGAAIAFRKVTIPEGQTSWEIFSILKQHYSNLDSLRFDSLVHSTSFAASCSLNAKSLEGYLFPETYHFPWHLSEERALRIMVKQFFHVIKTVELGNAALYVRHGLHGLTTMASIVEAEARVKSEMPTISGVFFNRLERGIALGADPTVRFFLRKMEGPLYVSELKNPSPYNTRVHAGLPPGPIGNPGRDAIFAAAFPEKTKYLFFVAMDDGTGRHFFSSTNRQHVRYKEVRKKNQKQKK